MSFHLKTTLSNNSFYHFYHCLSTTSENEFTNNMETTKSSTDAEFKEYMKNLRDQSKKSKKVSDKYTGIQPTAIPEMNKLSEKLGPVPISKELETSKEWIKKLKIWFAQVRTASQLSGSIDQSLKLVDIIRSIESGEMPQQSQVRSIRNAFKILELFVNNEESPYTKSDLAWIFSCFTNIDVVLLPENAEILQAICFKAKRQVSTKEDQLYPYLMVIISLIHHYFEQPIM